MQSGTAAPSEAPGEGLPGPRARPGEVWPTWAYRGPWSLPARLADMAQRHGERTALAWNGGQLSHAELAAAVGAGAARLQAAGVRPGQVVAVAAERSPEAVVALLAVLQAGAAYLPLDLAYPAARIGFMLRDAGASLLLAPGHTATVPQGVRLLDWAWPPHSATAFSAPPIDGDALAYVMYTSGTSGQPKGVCIEHRAILRLVCEAQFMPLNEATVMLQAAPLGFDASTLEVFGPLLNGGCCVLHDETVPTGAGLRRTVAHHGVNAAWLTSALFNTLVDEQPENLAGLQHLLIGGEALSVNHVARFMQAVPGTQLINGYGPTECTTFACTHLIQPADVQGRTNIPIGRPIQATGVYVLDAQRQPVADGQEGELYIGGLGVARGYLNRPELDTAAFFADPFSPTPGARMYLSGDLACRRSDGVLEYRGRNDSQVKVHGHRIEPAEIEAVLGAHPALRAVAVVPHHSAERGLELVAYGVPALAETWEPAQLRSYLAARLPAYMVPAHFIQVPALPLSANGKLDRRALPAPGRQRPSHLAQPYEAPRTGVEAAVAKVFAQVLGLDRVGALDNFFELGGNSLLLMKALGLLRASAAGELPAALLVSHPVPRRLAQALQPIQAPQPQRRHEAAAGEPVAIVGMAGRFPGADSIEAFWQVLDGGHDTVRRFSPEELDASIPPELRADAQYVPARGVLNGVDQFDAAFFGISRLEAELMDPQQRVFLELCWECLERAGQVPEKTAGAIGVFAGMYNASYFQKHVLAHPEKVARLGEFQVMLANEKDYLAPRVAHKLNLTGPTVSVHTACSTSLVAIAQAYDVLRSGQCELALAGGVAITCPPNSGYLHQEGSMLSPDGHTRPFDVNAAGTVFSDGAAVLLLKPLSAALADGNTIHAVIRGVAVNNDGAERASFTAPSIDGQAAVVRRALQHAQVDARSLSYVEAHGTATPLGDPIEVAALTRVFREHTPDAGFCRLGSLKSNTGHMVIAAGAAGVIKTALALAYERLPATVHYTAPNPKLGLEGSPFLVSGHPQPWPRGAQPRRAGVSAFGVGGTNAHVVLEEPPLAQDTPATPGPHELRLSARTPEALASLLHATAAHLEAHPALNLADVAHTLRVGRRDFACRTAVWAGSPAEAAAHLRERAGRLPPARSDAGAPEVVWMFTGQGAQYPGMGRELHAANPAFAAGFDAALAACQAHLPPGPAHDLRSLMFGEGAEALTPTEITQPATFCLQVGLARAWAARGLQPVAVVGHSVGEFAAAVVAGVLTLADAAALVVQRGRLMQAQAPGGMLSVRLAASAVLPQLPAELQLAADNGPQACVVAGPSAPLQAFADVLAAQGVACRALHTSHAFHSAMMAPAVGPMQAAASALPLRAPALPFLSTLTGAWLTAEQATAPSYWARHLREPVRFGPALAALKAAHPRMLGIELGPRDGLCSLARQQKVVALPSLGASAQAEVAAWRQAQADAWVQGLPLEPGAEPPVPAGRRIVLPTTPFERQSFWLPAGAAAAAPAALPAPAPSPLPPMPLAPPAPHTAADTSASLRQRLRGVFEELGGCELGNEDDARPFVQLGLDSLTLTQVALQLKRQFGVAITFRQLMEGLNSIDALVEHLGPLVPQQAPAAAPPAALPVASAGLPQAALLQQLIASQSQVMAQLLALQQGQPAAALPAPPAAAPAPVPAEDAERHSRYDVKKAFGAIARIHSQGTELSERQRTRLSAFLQRYQDKTRRSKAYTVQHRPHLADPRVVNGFRPQLKEIIYQIVVERSKGSRLWDLDGNEYIDGLNGFGMSLFGWQPEFVLQAVRRQLDSGYDIGPQHPLAGEVARKVCELTGFDRAGLCNTGSEAVMGCVRIARTLTGRDKIVMFTGAYHGIFDEVIVRGTRRHTAVPAAPGILPNAAQNIVVLDYGTPDTLAWLKAHASELAAVLVEPVQSRRPDFQPLEFLRELRTLTQDAGTLLIFDEVVTGFRCHPGGFQALHGIRADLGAYGKVLGGGFPIGVIAGRREAMDTLDGGHWEYGNDSIPTVGVTYFAGTFVRHPLALVAANAVLDHLAAAGPELQAELTAATAALVARLNAHARAAGAPLTVNTFASIWKITFDEEHPLQDLLFAMMRNRGLHVLDNFPCFMTTAHTADDFARIEAIFKEALAELQEADFMPRRAVAAATLDASRPPVAGARLGRDADGKPAWFIPNPAQPGKYLRVDQP